ncbi:NOP6 [Biomphalaria glabrata]|nr:NOP6 [Biomphalaria glabrata]
MFATESFNRNKDIRNPEPFSNGTNSHEKPSRAKIVNHSQRKNRLGKKNQMQNKKHNNEVATAQNKGVHPKLDQVVKEEHGPHTEETTPVQQRSKLRNRQTIAKPDSLKYEHDYNRGFHTKVMQNLFIESPKKKGKNGKRPTSEARKRKSSTLGEEQEGAKKSKAEGEGEIMDLYKFSLNLINGEVDTSKAHSSKDSKNKYVLFIGNLPYDITREQLEEHFRKTGGIKNIRIPRDKVTDKGRGFAYMEFDGRISHGIALRLHHTTLAGRKINVEFTSIGGGKSEARKAKLQKKNLKRKKMKYH